MQDQPVIQEQVIRKEEGVDNPKGQIQTEQNGSNSQDNKFVDEVKIGDKTIFTIPLTRKFDQAEYLPKQRKTRWGELLIQKQKVHEDVVFNPLEALMSGNSLLPITQYGQSDLQLKMAIYSDPAHRRKSKWHHDIEKTFTPPMINYISHEISLDEVQYLLRLYRLDELTSRMSNFMEDDPDVRSPSPQPIYDRNGKRVNTREVRRRDNLVRERVQIIEDCMKMRKTFVPPTDYKPLKKYKKIYLTDTAMNDTNANYMGRIIGRGGSTQKVIEQRSGCKISVKGRGANNHSKDLYQNYDRLHVLITADTDEQLEKGVQEIQKILNGEEDAELKAASERAVSLMNGIFNQNYCEICHEEGHRTWMCPHEATHNRNIIKCSICGEISHPTCDCPQKAEYIKNQQTIQQNRLLESQYNKFKEEIQSDKKPKESGTAFITDVDKQKLLSIEASKQPVTAADPVGGFALPKDFKAPIGIPKFSEPKALSFPVPKFDQTKK